MEIILFDKQSVDVLNEIEIDCITYNRVTNEISYYANDMDVINRLIQATNFGNKVETYRLESMYLYYNLIPNTDFISSMVANLIVGSTLDKTYHYKVSFVLREYELFIYLLLLKSGYLNYLLPKEIDNSLNLTITSKKLGLLFLPSNLSLLTPLLVPIKFDGYKELKNVFKLAVRKAKDKIDGISRLLRALDLVVDELGSNIELNKQYYQILSQMHSKDIDLDLGSRTRYLIDELSKETLGKLYSRIFEFLDHNNVVSYVKDRENTKVDFKEVGFNIDSLK